MHQSNSKQKAKSRKERARTLCTIDTYDPNFTQTYYHREGKENDYNFRNSSYLTTQTNKSIKSKKKNASHQKSQFSAYNQSRVRESSQVNKMKRAMSISQTSANRLKTDYTRFQPNATRNIESSIKKKLVFPIQDNYKYDCWQIVKQIYQNTHQYVFQAFQDINKKQKCVMLKLKDFNAKREYENQAKAFSQLNLQMKAKEKCYFLKIKKMFKDKKEWAVITDNYYHANWENDHFYMFLSRFKNNQTDLQCLVKQIVRNIDVLSSYNYSHGCLSLQSLYFPVSKNSLKLGQLVKFGNLQHLIRIDSKESFLSMKTMFSTPPQILNLIMFQCREEFNRDYLDVISRLQAGWQIDVWALGVLILQLLNGGPLSGQGSERGSLLALQKQLTIRYSYLLLNLNSNLRLLVAKMLNPNPSQRPHPKQILRLL